MIASKAHSNNSCLYGIASLSIRPSKCQSILFFTFCMFSLKFFLCFSLTAYCLFFVFCFLFCPLPFALCPLLPALQFPLICKAIICSVTDDNMVQHFNVKITP